MSSSPLCWSASRTVTLFGTFHEIEPAQGQAFIAFMMMLDGDAAELLSLTLGMRIARSTVSTMFSNRLERVVANLLPNAGEAVSPDLGQIVITTTRELA